MTQRYSSNHNRTLQFPSSGWQQGHINAAEDKKKKKK